MTYTMPKRVWQDDHQPALIEHPKPEVSCRVATESEIPAAAKRMRKLAVEHGWKVAATYARGTTTGRKPKVVDSLALRMSRPADEGRVVTRAVAVWVDGKWSTGYVWGPHLAPAYTGARAMPQVLTS